MIIYERSINFGGESWEGSQRMEQPSNFSWRSSMLAVFSPIIITLSILHIFEWFFFFCWKLNFKGFPLVYSTKSGSTPVKTVYLLKLTDFMWHFFQLNNFGGESKTAVNDQNTKERQLSRDINQIKKEIFFKY